MIKPSKVIKHLRDHGIVANIKLTFLFGSLPGQDSLWSSGEIEVGATKYIFHSEKTLKSVLEMILRP